MTDLGACSPQYLRLRAMPLRWGFVLVRNRPKRNWLVHIVQAETFGALAKLFLKGVEVRTLCDLALVTDQWELTPRLPSRGYLISCAYCRAALSHA